MLPPMVLRQIAHIREYQSAFNEHQTYERDVEEYFDTYWDRQHPNDLYYSLCSDLGIHPKNACLR